MRKVFIRIGAGFVGAILFGSIAFGISAATLLAVQPPTAGTPKGGANNQSAAKPDRKDDKQRPDDWFRSQGDDWLIDPGAGKSFWQGTGYRPKRNDTDNSLYDFSPEGTSDGRLVNLLATALTGKTTAEADRMLAAVHGGDHRDKLLAGAVRKLIRGDDGRKHIDRARADYLVNAVRAITDAEAKYDLLGDLAISLRAVFGDDDSLKLAGEAFIGTVSGQKKVEKAPADGPPTESKPQAAADSELQGSGFKQTGPVVIEAAQPLVRSSLKPADEPKPQAPVALAVPVPPTNPLTLAGLVAGAAGLVGFVAATVGKPVVEKLIADPIIAKLRPATMFVTAPLPQASFVTSHTLQDNAPPPELRL